MKKLLAAVLGLSMAVAGCQNAFAAMKLPAGHWEIEMRDSRYDVAMCGANGTQLCATLVWLGNGADNKENLPYLNTLIIDHASMTGPGRWQGRMNLYGHRANGTVKQISDDQFSLQGCILLVICKTYQMYRIK